MVHKVGRVLQFMGLVLLPIGISGEVAGKLTEKGELLIAGLGIAIFFAGWLVQRLGKPQ